MKQKEFERILEDRITKMRNTLAAKGKTYSIDGDRLAQFKKVAQIGKPQSSQQAWLGMWKKHLVKLLDMIESDDLPSKEQRDETLGDTLNYLVLLEAIWIEQGPGTYSYLREMLDVHMVP
jgi:hypothetical protein